MLHKILGKDTGFRLNLVNKTVQYVGQRVVQKKEFSFLPQPLGQLSGFQAYLFTFEYER